MTRLPPADFIAREFASGLSFIGLARKYGRTKTEIEAIVRRWSIQKGR